MTREEAYKLREQIVHVFVHVPDEEAADVAWMAERWESEKAYAVGDRVQYDGLLYKCRMAHTSQSTWTPDVTPSIWEVISPEHEEGTHDNSFTYNVGMEIFNGKFYKEDDVLYECIRDSGTPLYNRLADLIDIYVKVSN